METLFEKESGLGLTLTLILDTRDSDTVCIENGESILDVALAICVPVDEMLERESRDDDREVLLEKDLCCGVESPDPRGGGG